MPALEVTVPHTFNQHAVQKYKCEDGGWCGISPIKTFHFVANPGELSEETWTSCALDTGGHFAEHYCNSIMANKLSICGQIRRYACLEFAGGYVWGRLAMIIRFFWAGFVLFLNILKFIGKPHTFALDDLVPIQRLFLMIRPTAATCIPFRQSVVAGVLEGIVSTLFCRPSC